MFFCISAGNRGGHTTSNGEDIEEWNMVCFEPKEETTYDKIRKVLHPITLLVSCLSLITIIIAIASVQKWRDTEGLIMLNHAFSLFLGFIILFAINIPNSFFTKNQVACTVLGKTKLVVLRENVMNRILIGYKKISN